MGVVSVTGDPATPQEWAGKMAAELGGAPVLTVQGEGHAAIPNNDPCVTRAAVALLVDLQPWPDGATCP